MYFNDNEPMNDLEYSFYYHRARYINGYKVGGWNDLE